MSGRTNDDDDDYDDYSSDLQDSNSDGDAAFFRNKYSKALAEALHQAQEEQQQAAPPLPAELAHETYRQLCFDDPVVQTEGCRALARAFQLLASSSSDLNVAASSSSSSSSSKTAAAQRQQHLALSERFVGGLEQLLAVSTTRRLRVTSKLENNENKEGDDDDGANEGDMNHLEQQEPEPLFQSPSATEETTTTTSSSSSSSDSSSAYATLAWTVFARIPLAACTANNLATAAAALGSYRGAAAAADNDKGDGDNDGDGQDEKRRMPSREESAAIAENQAASSVSEATPQPSPATNKVEEETEVWATESDPSDYDFGEGLQQQQQQQLNLQDWKWAAHDTDPVALSQVPADTSWKDVSRAVTNLVKGLTYSKVLGTLSAAQWNSMQVSTVLTQLSLLFLVPNAASSSCLLFQQESMQHWQELGLQPTQVFRDAALHFTTQHSTTSAAAAATVSTASLVIWQDYLQLLQTLVQVHHVAATTTSSSSNGSDDTKVAPATWVGCSSLSSVCSHCVGLHGTATNTNTAAISSRMRQTNQQLTAVVQECVLACSDDLTGILEATAKSEIGVAAAIQWTFLSFFQVLVVPKKTSGTTTTALPNAQAQCLLNSGLFRQWLVWWDSMDPGSAACPPVQQSIHALCAASPTLLGKYAWRFPGLAARMTVAKAALSTETCAESALDVFLWNLVGIELAQNSTVGSVVQWKNAPKAAAAVAPTNEACREAAWLGFQRMCEKLVETLAAWRALREEQLPMSDNFPEQQKAAACFVRLVDSLLSTPLLSTLFVERMVSSSPGTASRIATIRAKLDPVPRVLAHWPQTAAIPLDTKLKALDEGDEPSGDVKPRTHKPGAEDETVAQLRKSCKVLQSLLDAAANHNQGASSTAFSSKAD